MDSRLIYITSKHLEPKILWIPVTESEWIYCGSKGEVKLDIVFSHISKQFTDSRLYVVLTRNNSFEADKENVIKAIEEFVGSIDFVMWDTKFENVIEFNKIGVFREGRLVFPVLI